MFALQIDAMEIQFDLGYGTHQIAEMALQETVPWYTQKMRSEC